MSANMKERVGLPDQAAEPYLNGMMHLQDELERLDLLIERQVMLFRRETKANQPVVVAAVKHQYISDEEVDNLLSAGNNVPQNSELLDRKVRILDQHIDQRILASLEENIFLPAVRLSQLFKLSDFEYLTLMICMAPELRGKYDRLYAYLQDDITRKRPSRDFILKLLLPNEEDRWHARSMLQKSGVLLDAELLKEVDDLHSPSGNSDLAKFFALDSHILEFLLGNNGINASLNGVLSIANTPRVHDDELVPVTVRRHLQSRIEQSFFHTHPDPVTLVYLGGAEGVGKRTFIASTCAELGCMLLELDLRHLSLNGSDSERVLKLAVRDSLLLQAPLLLSHGEVLDSVDGSVNALWKRLTAILDSYGWLVCITSHQPIQNRALFKQFSLVEHTLPMPDSSVSERVWKCCLENHGVSAEPADIASISEQFSLTAGQINDAIRFAVADAEIKENKSCELLSIEQLTSACRTLSNQKLARLALKVKPDYGWEDIVLPDRLIDQLRSVCSQVKHQHRVLNEWGFVRKFPYGRGISAMFSGPPGTGKTMAAQVVAKALGLDMYKIDLSSVVSKYIGETEKNLAQIFQEAETSNAVLVFDECDALFGKRTEISDSHDRYANIEVSFLLQKVEEYNGIVILTTNLRNNIDEAFIRRIRFIIDFPFPDKESRREIWKSLLPTQAAHVSEMLDFGLLAQHFVLSGGNIKNIVLNAAFMAADGQGIIGMNQILNSARYELEKIGKLWDENQFSKHLPLQSCESKSVESECQNG